MDDIGYHSFRFMASIKDKQKLEALREAGRRLATILQSLVDAVRPGMSTGECNAIAEKMIRNGGDTPAFLGYQPLGATYPFPATLCISVNDEVVHGIPGSRVLSGGDLVKFDLGLVHEGIFVDAARATIIGSLPLAGSTMAKMPGMRGNSERLLKATEDALAAGIAACRAGNRTGDIGAAIERVIKPTGFGIVEELGGHGVGTSVHEEPYIANYGVKGRGTLLRAGMVLAIEPIITEGSRRVYVAKDGYTFMTRDGKRACQVEHTILVTDSKPEIITTL